MTVARAGALSNSVVHLSEAGGDDRYPRDGPVSGTRILGIILLVGGILGLLYGHFDYTKETHEGQIGPFKFSIAEKQTAVIPSWASIAVIAAGVVLLVINRK